MAEMIGMVGIPPKMIAVAAKAIAYNPEFQLFMLAFGLMVSGLFGLLEIAKHVRRR